MRITHNKIGRNLNIVDGAKADKADKADKTEKSSSAMSNSVAKDSPALGELADLGSSTRIDMSPRAMDARRIKELAVAVPDVDEEKVARFQKLIDEGKYSVDSKAVADRMVDEHLSTAE